MTTPLQSSGTISVADINEELGRARSAPFSLNETAYRTLVEIPTPETLISLANGYGKQRRHQMTINLTSDVGNFNAYSAAMYYGYDNTRPIDLNIVVAAGVRVSSLQPASPAMIVSPEFSLGSKIIIVNNGYILGHGGQGGTSRRITFGPIVQEGTIQYYPGDAYTDPYYVETPAVYEWTLNDPPQAGWPGGDALMCSGQSILLYNNGVIAGGGGGGGAGIEGNWYSSNNQSEGNGAGGGGGAGIYTASGGGGGLYGVGGGNGSPGTWNAPGAGGPQGSFGGYGADRYGSAGGNGGGWGLPGDAGAYGGQGFNTPGKPGGAAGYAIVGSSYVNAGGGGYFGDCRGGLA